MRGVLSTRRHSQESLFLRFHNGTRFHLSTQQVRDSMNDTIETTLQEFTINDNSVVLVAVQEIDELPFFSVRYLVTRKFGFKTFYSRIHAENCFNDVKSAITVISAD